MVQPAERCRSLGGGSGVTLEVAGSLFWSEFYNTSIFLQDPFEQKKLGLGWPVMNHIEVFVNSIFGKEKTTLNFCGRGSDNTCISVEYEI